MNKPWQVLRLTVVPTALLAAGMIVGCGRSAIQETPPHIIASLSDHQYFWFLYRDEQKPQLRIWRINIAAPTFELFSAPVPIEENFRTWQLDGSWIWYLTDTGLWRIGRFPPDTGESEKFEPDLINVETIGELSDVLVENARIIIGGEMGLFLFDRQDRDLVKISGQQVAKLRRTPFGMVVFTDRSFFLLDTTPSDPALKKLIVKNGKSWDEVPPGTYVTADPDRHAILAMVDRSTMLFFELDDLKVELEPREYLREAAYFDGRLWFLTSKPRLIAIRPGEEEVNDYNLYHVRGVMSEFIVQDGRLRCGPIVVERRTRQPLVGAVRFWPGDIKPIPPIKEGVVGIDVKFLDSQAALENEENAHAPTLESEKEQQEDAPKKEEGETPGADLEKEESGQ